MKFLFFTKGCRLRVTILILTFAFLLTVSTPAKAWWWGKKTKITAEDLQKIITELRIYDDPDFPSYNDVFKWNYTDTRKLLEALNKKMEINQQVVKIVDIDVGQKELDGLTYGMYILNAINEKKLVEMGLKTGFPSQADGKFFGKLADNLANWRFQLGKILLEKILEGVFVAIGAPGISIGVSSLGLATDFIMIGLSIEKLNKVWYEKALWSYIQLRKNHNYDHLGAWEALSEPYINRIVRLSLKKEKEIKKSTEAYFKSLWGKYEEYISDSGLKEGFKAKQRKKLKALLLYALEAQPHPVIDLPLKITSSPYQKGDKIKAEFTIANKGSLPIFFKTITVGGRYGGKQEVIDFTKRHDIKLNIGESYNYYGTLTLTKSGKYHFFCAYQTPDDEWNTSIDLSSGLTDEDRIEDIVVGGKEEKTLPPKVIWTQSFNVEIELVQETSEGGYILAGGCGKGSWLIKTDPLGQTIWKRKAIESRYGDKEVGFVCLSSIQEASDGGYILGAIGGGPSNGESWDEVWLIKTDSFGQRAWRRIFKNKRSEGYLPLVRQASDGGYILGNPIFDDSDKAQPWLMKTDSKGYKQWEKTFKFEASAVFTFFQETSDGGYILIAPDDRLLIKIGSIRAPQNTEVLKNSTNYLESEDQEPEKVVPTSITYQEERNRLYKEGKLDEAIEIYKKALSLDPDDSSIPLALGMIYEDKGMFEIRNHYFEQARLLFSKKTDFYNSRGTIYLQKGKLDKATLDAEKALEIEPINASSHFLLGNIYEAEGKVAEAISEYQIVSDLDQDPKLTVMARFKMEMLIQGNTQIDSMTQAFANMKAIAKALEMWYTDNDEYPANLGTLIPNYISSLPSDPFDPAGGSYRYYVNDTKTLYLIVSNGPDGDNDVPGTAGSIDFTLSPISGELGGPNGITGDHYLAGSKWYNPANGTVTNGDLGKSSSIGFIKKIMVITILS